MDALVKAALDRVNETVNSIPEPKTTYKTDKCHITGDRTEEIKRAINAVDALKSALKTLTPNKPNIWSPDDIARASRDGSLSFTAEQKELMNRPIMP